MGYNLACISVSRTFSASSGAPARLSFESQEKEEGQTDRLTLTEGVCRGQERDRMIFLAWRTDRSESRNDRFELICPARAQDRSRQHRLPSPSSYYFDWESPPHLDT